jgi:hypothetical protein
MMQDISDDAFNNLADAMNDVLWWDHSAFVSDINPKELDIIVEDKKSAFEYGGL